MASETKKELKAERLIGLLLEEPKILQKILASLKPEAREYAHFKVIPDEKRVMFGKYSWGGFSGFWNNLIKCCDHISFDDFYIKVWDALLEMSTDPIVHEAIKEGLSREVLLQGVHSGDEAILQRFFDCCRHITDDGYWRDKGLKSNSAPHHHYNSCPYSGNVEIEVKPQNNHSIKQNLRVVDAIGDVFEIINVRWLGGRS